MRDVDVSIIILNWNSAHYLSDCISSIVSNTRSSSYEVIVIDGASFDGSAELVSREFPFVKFIQAPENAGFAKGNNFAAGAAKGRFLLFLNPDTRFLNSAVDVLRESLETCGGGIAGAQLFNTDNSLQKSCVQAFPSLGRQLLGSELGLRLIPSYFGITAFESRSNTVAVNVVSGACLMTSSRLFSALGGFSQEFFMYFEDTDYCYRASCHGHKILYVPEAHVVHHGGGSSAKAPSAFSSRLMVESCHQYFLRHKGPLYAALFRVALGASSMLRYVLLSAAALCAGNSNSSAQFDSSKRKWLAVAEWAFRRQTRERV